MECPRCTCDGTDLSMSCGYWVQELYECLSAIWYFSSGLVGS